MIRKDQPTIFDKSQVRAAVSSKSDGTTKSMGAQDIAEVTSNIKAIASQAGFRFDHIVAMNVGSEHAWDEIVAESATPDRARISIEDRILADALVTTDKSVVLMLPVADCNAVAMHDPVHEVLAVVHLGWQSTAVDLARKMIAYFQEQHDTKPEDLRIYVSPSIRSESYVFETVSQADEPKWQDFLHKTEHGIGIDLPGYNRQLFIEAGVPPEAIEVCPVNTATSDEYFSHYRAVRSGEPDGRFALFAQLQ